MISGSKQERLEMRFVSVWKGGENTDCLWWNGSWWSWERLNALAIDCENKLRDAGFEKGQRIALTHAGGSEVRWPRLIQGLWQAISKVPLKCWIPRWSSLPRRPNLQSMKQAAAAREFSKLFPMSPFSLSDA